MKNKIKWILGLVLTAVIIVIIVRNNRLDEKSYYEVEHSKRYGYTQYQICNSWPSDSIFHRCYFGLIDDETGNDTGPVYPDQIEFRYDGLAWDYMGHYVDKLGNVVVNCEKVEKENYPANPKKLAFKVFSTLLVDRYNIDSTLDIYKAFYSKEGAWFNNIFHVDSFDTRGPFSESGLACYGRKAPENMSYLYEYGYINRDGEIAIPFRFHYATQFFDCDCAIVQPLIYDGEIDENDEDIHTGYGVINSKGEYVIQPKYQSISYFDGVFKVDTWDMEKLVFDAEGNLIEVKGGN